MNNFKRKYKGKQKKVSKVYAQNYLYKNYELSRKKKMSNSNLCDNELPDFEDDENRSVEIMKTLKPYQFEPEQEVSETDTDDSDTESFEEEGSYDEDTVRAGCLNWYLCLKCKVEEREINCLCCQELAVLNEKKYYTYHRG